MSQSANTADADAGEDVAVVLESFCFLCTPAIVDEQCKVNVIVGVLILKRKEICVAYLWLTHSFWTNVQMVSTGIQYGWFNKFMQKKHFQCF
jgi:hypothetical protein